eukprot:10948761-Alexandrium_andersonii.AAC.1
MDGVFSPHGAFPYGLQWQVMRLLDVRELRGRRRARRVELTARPVTMCGADPFYFCPRLRVA